MILHTTTLCLIRHGVTDWNCEGRNQGRTDIPLNREGALQAAAMAGLVATEHWDAVYASPLSRAYATAQAITALTGHVITTDPRLMERDMGLAEGTTHWERCARWPGVHWKDLPGVESDQALADRATEVLVDIAKRHPGERVICVAHGGLISAFLQAIVPPGGKAPPIHQRNTSFVYVAYDAAGFRQLVPSNYGHLLVDGVEYSGEKGRLLALGLEQLGALLPSEVPLPDLEAMLAHASAIEAAWVDERLVGFLRCFTDGINTGYIDLTVAAEEYGHVLPILRRRIAHRFPRVAFQELELAAD